MSPISHAVGGVPASAATLVALVITLGAGAAQDLRRPPPGVVAAFPAADGFQAITRDVDAAARTRIERRLPFRVHLGELGPHVIHVALRGRVPIGMVYLRREEDSFGLTEVEWAITLDQRIAGFRFQRTRSRHRSAIEGSEFARRLTGLSATEVHVLLAADGTLNGGVRGVPQGARELAAALTRSALKALIVVDEIWGQEVQKLHDLALGANAFPAATRFVRVWPPLAAAPAAPPASGDDAAVLVAVRAFRRDDRALGVVARVAAPDAPGEACTWIVDGDGRVLAVHANAGAAAALRASYQAAVGERLDAAIARDASLAKAAGALLRLLEPGAGASR